MHPYHRSIHLRPPLTSHPMNGGSISAGLSRTWCTIRGVFLLIVSSGLGYSSMVSRSWTCEGNWSMIIPSLIASCIDGIFFCLFIASRSILRTITPVWNLVWGLAFALGRHYFWDTGTHNLIIFLATFPGRASCSMTVLNRSKPKLVSSKSKVLNCKASDSPSHTFLLGCQCYKVSIQNSGVLLWGGSVEVIPDELRPLLHEWYCIMNGECIGEGVCITES